MNIKKMVKRLLENRENRRYEKLLRDKVSYQDWVTALEREQEGRAEIYEGKQDGHAESCEYVVIRVGDGMFASCFCGYVQSYFAAHPETFLLYGDEDVGDRGQGRFGSAVSERRLPWFKPDWSPDLLDSFFYFGSAVVVRAELFHRAIAAQGQEVCQVDQQEVAQFSAFTRRDENAGRGMECYVVSDFDAYEVWMHWLVELAGGYVPGSGAVGHVAMPWFICDDEESRSRYFRETSFLRKRRELLLQRFRNRGGCYGYSDLARGNPVVSAVILSKDHPEILEKCLRGCELGARGTECAGLSYEVILVDNGSNDENRSRVEALVRKFTSSGCRITYLYRPQTFNFSKLCNLGVEQAAGELLLFLNDDVELCQPGCMEVMAALADRPWTGAVGLKLYYPDSVRIQHAGVTNILEGPAHKLQFLDDDKEYYYGANRGRHNALAVTAACLMVTREKYRRAGGFTEELPVAYNDVDFCFRLYELGYQNVCVNDMYAYHYESLSRGDDDTPEKMERLFRERVRLYERHPALEGKDPYYSPHLNHEGLDRAIRPAYLTARNTVQKVEGRLETFSLKGYRRDDCLMVRVEDCRNRKAMGYGVVLGDNNACYEKVLLLKRIQDGRECVPEEYGKERDVYAIRLVGQYRPDLVENIPNQVNVGFSGFRVEVGKGVLPKGRYQLGMGARNRIANIKIVNWSNRMLEL